jgi:Domain of unknown function (DUF1707)
MAARPDLRVGDAEREARAAELREHYAQGRLSLTEFNERLDAVFACATQRQLDQLTADLPHVRVPGAPLPVTARGAIPPGGGGPGGSRSQPGPRGVRGVLATISGLVVIAIAALTAWLVVAPSAAAPFWGMPWAGRAGILLAILAIVRGLLRRIFGLGRRGHWHGHQRW